MNGFLQNSQPLPQGFVEVFDLFDNTTTNLIDYRAYTDGKIIVLNFTPKITLAYEWTDVGKINAKYYQNFIPIPNQVQSNGTDNVLITYSLKRNALSVFSKKPDTYYHIMWTGYMNTPIQQPVVTPSNNFVDITDDFFLDIDQEHLLNDNSNNGLRAVTNGNIVIAHFTLTNIKDNYTIFPFRPNPKYLNENHFMEQVPAINGTILLNCQFGGLGSNAWNDTKYYGKVWVHANNISSTTNVSFYHIVMTFYK